MKRDNRKLKNMKKMLGEEIPSAQTARSATPPWKVTNWSSMRTMRTSNTSEDQAPVDVWTMPNAVKYETFLSGLVAVAPTPLDLLPWMAAAVAVASKLRSSS